jgi:hypothetical protein
MGVVSVNASTKVGFFQSTQANLLTQTILASYTNVDAFKYIAGDIALKPQYLAMVNTPAFRQNCGDYLIIGEQSGRWFFGTAQLVVKDTVTESKLAQSGVVDVSYGTYSASVDENTVNKMKQASNSTDIHVNVISSDASSPMSLTIDQFLAQTRSFPTTTGNKQTFMLKAVPYETIVTNWPPSNPLAPLTSAQKLNVVAGAAAGLIALVDDANFVTRNPGLFAMGTQSAKRAARLAYITARKNRFQAELDTMRNTAKDCDVDWKAQCDTLYEKWKNFTDFAIAEYGQFPIRYLSDCYSPRDAGDLSTKLSSTTDLAGSRGHFTSTRGDHEMGGGPISFSAYLDFRPNFSGGDPLAARTLLADFKISMEETKGDHSTFEYRGQYADAFDLSKPDYSGGSVPATLAQCSFNGTGVKAPQVTPDSSICNSLWAVGQVAVDNCRQAIALNKHHGILSATTTKNARTEVFSKNPLGVFRSMTCTVDGGTDEDQTDIGCSSVSLLAIQLDLVNKADIAADSWVAPFDPTAFRPPGLTLNPGFETKLRSLRVMKTTTLRTAPRRCPGGLVNVGGSCVPALKR